MQLRPMDWRGFSSFGVFLGRQGRYAESAQAFQTAIELSPDNDLNYRNLGVTYQIMGRFKESEIQLRKALSIEESSRAYEDLSLAYLLQGLCSDAVSASETAVEMEPQFYRLWGNLARAYDCKPGHEQDEREALTKAIALGEQRITVRPNDFLTRSLLADYWARLGDRNRALEEIEKIPDLPRQAAEVQFQVATALQLAGLGDRAMTQLEQALRGDFRLEDAIHHPSLFELRKNPKFQEVLERVRADSP